MGKTVNKVILLGNVGRFNVDQAIHYTCKLLWAIL